MAGKVQTIGGGESSSRRARGGALMDVPNLVISETPTPFAAVWVHLKRHPHQPLDYEVRVPTAMVQSVFDPGSRRPPAASWSDFLWSEIEKLGGTFAVSGW